MRFYDLAKDERLNLVAVIKSEITDDIANSVFNRINSYFNHDHTYIRKTAHLSLGRIYLRGRLPVQEFLSKKWLSSIYCKLYWSALK